MTDLVPDLAGLQDDPLAEYVLAVEYTAAPVRNIVRSDTRRHWQWMARNPLESAAFVWLSYAQPITDQTPIELAARAKAPLDQLVPDRASSVETSARIVRFNQVDLTIRIVRLDGTTFEQTLTLDQGVPDAT